MGEAGKAMDPELVTPVVVYLSHTQLRSHGTHLLGRGREGVAGVHRRHEGDRGRALSAESVAESIDQIDDQRPSPSAAAPLAAERQNPWNWGRRRSAKDAQALLQVLGSRDHLLRPGLLLECTVTA